MSTGENANQGLLLGAQAGNLYGVINKDKVYGLNLDVPEDAKEVIKPWDERESTDTFAESGVDDQIILHIPFTRNVRVRSIQLKIGRGELAPQQMRIYANHPNIVDFSDAESTRPHLNISLLTGETSVVEYPLRVPAFASISTLSIFFSDAIGTERTRIYYIGFRGDSREERKEAEGNLLVPAANAADAPLVDRVAEKSGQSQTTAR